MKAARLHNQLIKTDSHILDSVTRVGRWFLHSGIQQDNGGVARFYRADLGRNLPVSTEITGYTTSALMYLHSVTGDALYLDRARHTAAFLANDALDTAAGNFPFEHGPGADSLMYFFDCGIIVRSLLAVWRVTRDESLLARALECGRAMLRDFDTGSEIHPILTLPEKAPIARDWRWSRNPGCYQLKAALSWRELAALTGDAGLSKALGSAFDRHLARSLADYSDFLPGNPQPERVMDRLHAFSYFLESLLSFVDDERCALALADGIARVSRHLREISPQFARSDVYAQLLRVRLWASVAVPLDTEAAKHEASVLEKFQLVSEDPRMAGGFTFGTLRGETIPHVNPVSAAFALQALHMWHTGVLPPLSSLI